MFFLEWFFLLKLDLEYCVNSSIIAIILYTLLYLIAILYNICALYSSRFNYGWAKYRQGYISYEQWSYDQLLMQYSFSPFMQPYLYCIAGIYCIAYDPHKILLCIILQIIRLLPRFSLDLSVNSDEYGYKCC